MTPEQIEQERQAFEAWAKEMGNDDRLIRCENDDGIDYEDISMEYAWNGWKARAAESAWISVEDRLPEPYEGVLAYDAINDEVTIEFIYERNEKFSFHNIEITHWHPLPKSPIE